MWPKQPVNVAGIRIEPPPSLAVTSGIIAPAIAAEDPPLEPPGVRSRFHGLRETPNSRFFVSAVCPNSGALVLPTTIAPAARSRATCTESCSGLWSRNGTDP
ncbi:MAG: hypothetical protein M5U32_01230 [Myxococcota bacterium]|nr:hypothetical protein [Myxococcota bacterium]